MVASIKRVALSAVRRAGYEIVLIDAIYPSTNRLLTMITHHRIDTVIDVGANTGQYASALRKAGYTGRIISFEPLSEAYAELEKKSRPDPKWRVFQTAI